MSIATPAVLPGTEPSVEEVAPGVFAVVQLDGTWGLSNAAVIDGGSHSVLVDTFFTEVRNHLLKDHVRAILDGEPDFLVNTHHHGDHVFGNGFYPDSLVVAHHEAGACIAELNPSVSSKRFPMVDFGEPRPTQPTITFERTLRLHTGAYTVDVIFPGLAHCPGNVVVHVLEAGVLIAGDLLTKSCTPSFMGGSAQNYHAVIERLRSLGASVVIPGHGPVCGPEVLDDTARYVDMVSKAAIAGLATGAEPLEVARSVDLGEFATWHDHERLVGNLHRAMSEFNGGAPVDVLTMWRETEEYLGHPVQSRA